ncbi:MAG TPA: CmpA/NrtA family ABC transporter substrate-binding protein [Telluria sp.]|nr:CmpA/NrtA family ABC transporter substrate-binding protein [Telluria sp.]
MAGLANAGAMAPELDTVRVGFMPLTDCAALVMASVLGFDQRYGIRIDLRREMSWSSVRDKLCDGALDASHALYGLVTGAHLGIGARQRDMAVLMGLSQNGQGITLSRRLASRGAVDGDSLKALIGGTGRRMTFAHTFPGGNHALLLNYWLAAHGIDPLHDVRLVTLPPSQMADNLEAGHLDGFCAGEPWGARAVQESCGITVATSQQIWRNHPGKVLGASADFVRRNPRTCIALVAAVLDAARWIEADEAHREAAAEVLASPAFINASQQLIAPRLLGRYQDGLGKRWLDPDRLRLHGEGEVNFPWLSDAMWFMTQQRRWGMLKTDPDYLVVAGAINQIALYREAAELSGTPQPAGLMRSAVLIDGKPWDGSAPAAYAASFSHDSR